MKNQMKKLSPLLLLLVPGCMTVPQTDIGFSPATHTLSIKSPKNIQIGYLRADVTGTNVSITVSNYTSSNSPEVIAAVGRANLDTINAAAKAGQDALTAAMRAAAGVP